MDIGAARTDEEREATYRFLNDEIADEHRLLREEARGIDTKATLVAGFGAASITFLLDTRRQAIWWLALLCYGLALTAAFVALWPRRWDGLKPSALEQELGEAAPVFVAGQVAGSKVVIYERNHRRAARKAILWTLSVALLGFGAVFAVWSTVVEHAHD